MFIKEILSSYTAGVIYSRYRSDILSINGFNQSMNMIATTTTTTL